ncbi:hypothetical protein EVG20_g4026 [Dentipellis fragilis]|uniref:Uncharacterized protein n=1 Tax=Dentipellis fragilis TaxID=205917 RepID=A0A4Y9YXV9_9AGAM|nr:hypothetical protein EVG20_g4026 [Dentipellis fragilis]
MSRNTKSSLGFPGPQPQLSQYPAPPPATSSTSRNPQQPQPQPQPQSVPNIDANWRPRNALEALLAPMLGSGPDGVHIFTDDQLDAHLGVTGKPADVRARARQRVDEAANAAIEEANGVLSIWGFKPGANDKVHVIPIPNSELFVRLWDGGLADDGLFLLDFAERGPDGTLKATNSRGRFKLYPQSRPGIPNWPGPLISLEEAFGYKEHEIKEGAEKFSVPEASACILQREHHPPFVFDVPARQRSVLYAGLGPLGRTSTFANP